MYKKCAFWKCIHTYICMYVLSGFCGVWKVDVTDVSYWLCSHKLKEWPWMFTTVGMIQMPLAILPYFCQKVIWRKQVLIIFFISHEDAKASLSIAPFPMYLSIRTSQYVAMARVQAQLNTDIHTFMYTLSSTEAASLIGHLVSCSVQLN